MFSIMNKFEHIVNQSNRNYYSCAQLDSAAASLQELYSHEMLDDWWVPLEFTGNYNLVRWQSGFWAGWYVCVFILITAEFNIFFLFHFYFT